MTAMKHRLIHGILFVLAACLSPSRAQTTYVSNSTDTPGGVIAYNTQWLAESFITGANPDGYLFDSTMLSLSQAGTPTFSVFLYDNNANFPGTSLATLNDTGSYKFTSPGLALTPSTTYWVVITASLPFDSSNYIAWNIDGTIPVATGGWSINTLDRADSATSGASWGYSGGNYGLSVAATAVVPEPSTCALLISAILLGFRLCRRGQSSRSAC